MEKITSENNFIRIFRLPEVLPSDFCFDGGQAVTFWLVDWFSLDTDTLSKTSIEMIEEVIRKFVKGKIYYHPNFKFLAITDYGEAFLI